MADLLAGSDVLAVDTPPTVGVLDTTSNNNVSNTSYATGTPEVGVTFTAPTTGRVLIIIGGGLDNNGSNTDRVALAPQVFETDSSGTEVLAPTVFRGISSEGVSEASSTPGYRGRTTFLAGLTPGQQYYARVMHIVFGSNATCDISSREIIIAPAT